MYLVDCNVRAGCENKAKQINIKPNTEEKYYCVREGERMNLKKDMRFFSPDAKNTAKHHDKRVTQWGWSKKFYFCVFPSTSLILSFFSLVNGIVCTRERRNNHLLI